MNDVAPSKPTEIKSITYRPGADGSKIIFKLHKLRPGVSRTKLIVEMIRAGYEAVYGKKTS